MGGLEAIINQINSDAEKEAKAIVKETQGKCDAIMAETKAIIESMTAEGDKKAEKEANLEYEKMKSAALMKEKQEKLRAKQEIIADVIDKAYNRLENLPDKEYFEFLLSIIPMYAQPKSGVICLNEKDLKRVTEDFENRAGEMAEKNGGSLTIQSQPVDIENGMILDYGDIEENCTLKALFNNKREILQDKINQFLFK